MRKLPLVVEHGIASTRLARNRLAGSFALRVGLDRVTCSKGCSHCCHYPLTISVWEGIVLYRALRDQDQWCSQLRQELERHSSLTLGTAPEAWLLAEIPCPLLEEDMCRLYQQRPFRCRVTVSTQDPDLCRPVYFGPSTFEGNRPEVLEFESTESRSAKASREHVRGLEQRVPVSTAILIGYQVDEGIITLEDVAQTLLRLLSQGR